MQRLEFHAAVGLLLAALLAVPTIDSLRAVTLLDAVPTITPLRRIVVQVRPVQMDVAVVASQTAGGPIKTTITPATRTRP